MMNHPASRVIVVMVGVLLGTAGAMSPPAQASMDKALLAIAQGNVASAVTTLEPLVSNGDPAAMTLLGDLLVRGRGVTADADRAMSLYKRAAIQGHGPAQLRYGSRLTQQPGKLSEGQNWLEKAAEQREPLAMRALGIIHRDIHDDPVEAARWLARAQAHGDGEAKVLIADLQARQKARVADAQARARGETPVKPAPQSADGIKPQATGIKRSYGTPANRRTAERTPAELADAIARGEVKDDPDAATASSGAVPKLAAKLSPDAWPDWLQAMPGGGYPGVLHGNRPETAKPDDLRSANGTPSMDDLLAQLVESFGSRDFRTFAALTHVRSQPCNTADNRVFYQNYLGDSLLKKVIPDLVTKTVTPMPVVPQLALDRTGSYFPVFPTHEVKISYKQKAQSNFATKVTLHLLETADYGWFIAPPCPSEPEAQWIYGTLDLKDYRLPQPISSKAQGLRDVLSDFEDQTVRDFILTDQPFQAFVNIRAADMRIGDDLAWEILNLIEMEIGARPKGSIPLAP